MATKPNALEQLAAACGIAPSKVFPKEVRDALAAQTLAAEHLTTALAIESAGEQEVENYLARKAEHEAEQAKGDPLSFKPFAESAPNVERLRSMTKAYRSAKRQADRRAGVALGDHRLPAAYAKLWRDHVAVEISPSMTVGDAAAIEARATAVRGLLTQAILGNAKAAGATQLEETALRRALKNAQGSEVPSFDGIGEKLTGKTKAEVARDRKLAEQVTAENNRLAQEAALSAQARTRRIVEESRGDA